MYRKLTAIAALTVAISAMVHAAPSVNGLDIVKARMKSLKTFQAVIKTTTALDPLAGGQGTKFSATQKLHYAAPNKTSITISGIMGNIIVVSDGKTVTQYSDLSKQYSVKPAPKSLATSLVAGLAKANLAPAGKGSVGGESVNIYKGVMTTERGTANVTLELASDSLPRKLTVVIPNLRSQRGAYRVTTTQTFSNVFVDKPIPDSRFVFVPPPGATKADHVPGMVSGETSGIPGMP
ncbi:MAG TPA: DUF2092 domain-containing protein [Capsulimonadaceae bacterium]|jgi:outer membrane lipoprotein-sorting protein